MMQLIAFITLLSATISSCVAAQTGGSTSSMGAKQEMKSVNRKTESVSQEELKQPFVEQVGLHPQVFYYHNFLSELERTHLIRLAAPTMKRSMVSGDHGQGVLDDIRTSYGMFVRRLHDPIVTKIQERISLFTHIPVIHQEDIQILRYTKGQKYGAHYDSAYDTKEAGPHHRLATFYIYLSDVEEGGETAFPQNSQWYDPSMANLNPNPSECAKGHVHAKPKAGDAVVFYSFFPNGTMDMASMHTGCPVIKGIKWGAPIWIHVDEFMPESYGVEASLEETREPGLCEDYHTECKRWAAMGECEKNQGFMMGRGGDSNVGTCRRSCKACAPCTSNDLECINKNRKASGFLEYSREEMDKLGVDWWFPDPSPEL